MNITLLTTASVLHSGDTLNAPYGTKPVIDGLISAGEWDDADTVMTMALPNGPVTIYAKEYPDSIYFAVNVPDSTSHPNDRAILMFDSLNNADTLPNVDDFTCSMKRNGTRASQHGNGTGWANDSTWGWNSAVTASTNGYVVEYSVAFRKAGLSFGQPKILGFSVEIINTNLSTVLWPDSAINMNPSTWGDLFSPDNWGSNDSVGPVTSGIQISPPNPPQGITNIVVYALVSDSLTGQSMINDAQVFIDSTVAAYNMMPLDGNFDEMTEGVFDTVPVTGWVAGDTHWVYVRGMDIARNWGMFDSVPVIVAAALDTTPPWIITTFPGSGQTDVPLDAVITATFSEQVDPATVTLDKFTMNGSINGAYTFTINYDPIDSTVSIDPTISFASAESITVVIAPGIQDLAGNPMPDTHSWWFKALVLPDSVGPVTSSVSISPPNPPQGITEIIAYALVSDSATGQSLINDAEAFLDSIGQPGTGYIMTALDGGYDEIAEDVFDTIPVSGWVAGDTHWVYIHGRDIGNNWGAFDSASAIVVSLIDTVPPGIAYTSPAFGDTGVTLNSWIYVTFNEKVDPTTVTSDKILIEGSINGNYTFWMSYFETDSTLRINPYSDFAPMESINVYIAAGIQDLAGNPMLSGYWWWFRSGAITDTAKPRVDSLIANPDTITGANGVTVITSRITDNIAVAGAEYFIDAIGVNGTGYGAHASDSFGLTIAHTLDTIVIDTIAYGMHRFFLHGVDATGNWGPYDTAAVYKIAVDTLHPDVDSLRAVPDTVDLYAQTIITSRITDNIGVTAAEFFIDSVGGYGAGYAAHPVDSFGPLVVHTRDTVQTDTLISGRHWVYLRGRDAAGNWSICDSVPFVIVNFDSTGPHFTITAIPSPVLIGDSISITADVSEPLNPDSAVTCLIRNADTTVAHTMVQTDTFEYQIWVQTTGFPEGTCRAVVSGYDERSNYGVDSVQFAAVLDSIGPDFIVAITPSPAHIGDSALVTAQTSDTLHPDSLVTCFVRTADSMTEYIMTQTDSFEYSAWVQTVGFSEDTCWALVAGYNKRSTYGIDSLQFAVMAEGEFLPKDRVYAWPNPAKGNQVFFHFYVSMNARVRVTVFNLEGRRVWQSTEQNAAGGKPPHTMNSNAVVWDISRIASDVYIFRLEATNTATDDISTVIKKFAIVR
ncbi:MAG TPA: Ig-like domain-containing protein [bacterium]